MKSVKSWWKKDANDKTDIDSYFEYLGLILHEGWSCGAPYGAGFNFEFR